MHKHTDWIMNDYGLEIIFIDFNTFCWYYLFTVNQAGAMPVKKYQEDLKK